MGSPGSATMADPRRSAARCAAPSSPAGKRLPLRPRGSGSLFARGEERPNGSRTVSARRDKMTW